MERGMCGQLAVNALSSVPSFPHPFFHFPLFLITPLALLSFYIPFHGLFQWL
jgi:hypothetical protein